VQAITAIPGIFSLIVAIVRSPAAAFLDVYLPVLLLLPDYYRWVLPGLPDPSFHHAAILPIAVLYAVKDLRRWRFSFTDLLVCGYAFSVGFSEYLAAGYKDAQNLLFDVLCGVLLPYMLAKGLIEPRGLRVAFAKRVVQLLFVVAVLSLYELKMGRPLWAIVLSPFFPGQGSWVTTFRWGFTRVAGPYGHAILAGVIFAAGYRLQRWLEWSGAWKGAVQFGSLRLTKARVVTLGIAGGLFMTMCRGPWLGAMAAAAALAFARARNRRRAVAILVAVTILGGIPAAVGFKSYISVTRLGATTTAQESAVYRKELIQQYIDIALRKETWGWGRNTWPRLPGMPSIDNHYLLLALMHGLIALGFFVAIFPWMAVRLARCGLRSTPDDDARLLAYTLLSLYVGYSIAIATVFLGTQAVQLFFILTGWAEGLILIGREKFAREVALERAPRAFHFARVMA
jgi:hypothetical protein